MAYIPRGIDYLRTKLNCKRSRVKLRYAYYNMKNHVIDFGIATPPSMRNWNSCIGWCAKSVDSLADRLQFKEFRNDIFDLNTIYQLNNPDIMMNSAMKDALIASCSFIYISQDEEGFPRMQVIDAGDATGILDPITYMLLEGYAVLKRDDLDQPIVEAYFLPGKTEIYEAGKKVAIVPNLAPYALLVPIINRPDAQREFGHSRISRACMSLTGSALRTIKRSEITAEFYSFPQKYINGLSEEAEFAKWDAAMSAFLALTKDEDGEKPTVGQFTQASMTPHLDQLKMFAALFAGETGLTLADLLPIDGGNVDSDTIKASHENLRLAAKNAKSNFGIGFLNAGFLAACVRDGVDYRREQLYNTKLAWYPTFEPDVSELAGIGDAIYKISQSFPEHFDELKLFDLTGL